MHRPGDARSIIAVTSLAVFSWLSISPDAAFAIGEGAQANEYARWCAQKGGTITNQGGLGCIPGSSGGGSFGGGGYSSRQQAALGMAGAFGSMLGNGIRQGMEEDARRAAMKRMQEEWENDQERIRLEEERKRQQDERERKHHELMSKLKGSLGGTELGMKRMGSESLQLKSGSDLFGRPGPAGTLQQEVPVAAGIPNLSEPATVKEGRAAHPGLKEETEKAWDDYLTAVQRKNQAEAKLKQTEADQRMIEQLRREAEKKLQEQRARAAVIPPDRPQEKKVEDDKLAQAERLLQDAIKLDEEATQDLAAAQREAEGAKAALSEAAKKKQHAMKAEKE